MNLFRILASGKHQFREEFVSAYLAYLLSPSMDHGLGSTLLVRLLEQLTQHGASGLRGLVTQLDDRLQTSVLGEDESTVFVELEFPYPTPKGGHGYIDIVLRCGDWFILIENKILARSLTRGQVEEQYRGLRQVLADKEYDEAHVLVLFVVPALPGEAGWTVSEEVEPEVQFDLREGDLSSVVHWQDVDDAGVVSIVGTIREVLRDESCGDLSPLTYDTRQTLLSWIDFIHNGFAGFPFQRAVERAEVSDEVVATLLARTESL